MRDVSEPVVTEWTLEVPAEKWRRAVAAETYLARRRRWRWRNYAEFYAILTVGFCVCASPWVGLWLVLR